MGVIRGLCDMPGLNKVGVNGLEEGIVVEAQFQIPVVAQGVGQACSSLPASSPDLLRRLRSFHPQAAASQQAGSL